MYHLIDLIAFLKSYYWVAFLPLLVLVAIQGLGLIKNRTIRLVACVSFAMIWVCTLFYLGTL